VIVSRLYWKCIVREAKEKKDCERHEKARKRGEGDGEGEGEEDKLIQRPKLHTRLRPLLSASLSLCCLPLGLPSYSPRMYHFQFNGRRKTYTRIEEFKRRERELKLEKKWRINGAPLGTSQPEIQRHVTGITPLPHYSSLVGQVCRPHHFNSLLLTNTYCISPLISLFYQPFLHIPSPLDIIKSPN
jgi:hypothetical protein